MEKYNKRNEIDFKTVIVTADIGKLYYWGYLRCSYGDVKTFRFKNNPEGLKYLWQRIEEFMKAYNLEKIFLDMNQREVMVIH